MYLDTIASAIRSQIPEDRIPEGDSDELFRIYAVLLRAKGTTVCSSDVHDAWVAWMAQRDPHHTASVEYDKLPHSIRTEDLVFVRAIQHVATQLEPGGTTELSFRKILFPSGTPKGEADIEQALDLYKIMVKSSEQLVNRRQGVNTYFLTMNGAILTASGLIVQGSGGIGVAGLGVAVISVAGAILCGAWRSLIISFGQLNGGKFRVIDSIERHLKVAIYAAEWEALGRGEDPKVYRSFTSREIWVPNALLVVHIVAAVVALVVAVVWITQAAGVSIPHQ